VTVTKSKRTAKKAALAREDRKRAHELRRREKKQAKRPNAGPTLQVGRGRYRIKVPAKVFADDILENL